MKWRAPRTIAALAIGWFMVFSPAAVAAEPVQAAEPALVQVQVQAQAPEPAPPGPEGDQPQGGKMDPQRYAIGVTGAALIGLVLLSRKMRKKPLIGFEWKKKG